MVCARCLDSPEADKSFALPKTVRVDVYRSDGSPIQSEHIVTLAPRQSIDIRIEERTTVNKSCWARVEDISKNKSRQPLEASARVEHITGNTLEDFPEDAFPSERTGKWLSPAKGVSNKLLFFLNVSDRPTVLEMCSVNTGSTCSAENAKPLRTAVKPRQAVVLKIGNLQRRTLSIRSTPAVMSIIGLLQPEMPKTREYSSESSVSFDEPAQK